MGTLVAEGPGGRGRLDGRVGDVCGGGGAFVAASPGGCRW